jgi:hypothetical protein
MMYESYLYIKPSLPLQEKLHVLRCLLLDHLAGSRAEENHQWPIAYT